MLHVYHFQGHEAHYLPDFSIEMHLISCGTEPAIGELMYDASRDLSQPERNSLDA